MLPNVLIIMVRLPTYLTLEAKKLLNVVSGGGSVGIAVASDSRGLRFESIHRQKFTLNIYCQLYWKDENKEKEAVNGQMLKVHHPSPWRKMQAFKSIYNVA